MVGTNPFVAAESRMFRIPAESVMLPVRDGSARGRMIRPLPALLKVPLPIWPLMVKFQYCPTLMTRVPFRLIASGAVLAVGCSQELFPARFVNGELLMTRYWLGTWKPIGVVPAVIPTAMAPVPKGEVMVAPSTGICMPPRL